MTLGPMIELYNKQTNKHKSKNVQKLLRKKKNKLCMARNNAGITITVTINFLSTF